MEEDPNPGRDNHATEADKTCDEQDFSIKAAPESGLNNNQQATRLDGVTAVINPPAGLFAPVCEEEDNKKDEAEDDFSMASFIDVKLPDESNFSFRTHWRGEFAIMLKLALPCIVTNTTTQIMVITNQIFVGHIGVNEFAAAALANTWFNLLWSFMLGASTAMDTLASQAYGSKDYRSLLVWTYSGLIINTLFCFPLMGALLVGEHAAAVLFHQGYGPVATLVSDFCKALIPGLWPLIWSMILMKFLQTQNSMAMPAIIAGLACVINVGINFWLVGAFGFVGSPWATTACRIVQALLILAACIHQQHKAIKRAGLTWRDWTPMSRMAFKTACHPSILWEHGKLALAGGVMNAFEATAFDVTTAFAGALGVTATAAHSALLSICSFCFNALPFAISIAATIRCANLLGAGRPKQARLAGMLSMVLGVAFQGATGIVLGASQGEVVRIFTSDPDVLASVKTIAWLAMIFQFSDGLFGTAQGVLRAMGGQVGCIVYNLLGFWGGGVLVGWLLTFKAHMGLMGLWIGLLSGDVFATVLSVIALSKCNWRAAATKLFAEVQQAALDRAAEGDLRDQLAADEAQGFIANVDMTDFSKEMQFFIVAPPEDEGQPTLDTPAANGLPATDRPASAAPVDFVAAVLAGLRSGSRYSFIAAPGMLIQARGGSVTAAMLANSRMLSITTAQRAATHRVSITQFQPEHVNAGSRQSSMRYTAYMSGSQASPLSFRDDPRSSGSVRLMRPPSFGIHSSDNNMQRRSNRHNQEPRSSGHDLASSLKARSAIYTPPASHLAAALSRGGNVETNNTAPSPFRSSLNQIGAALGHFSSVQQDRSSRTSGRNSISSSRSMLRMGSLPVWRGSVTSLSGVDRSSANSAAGHAGWLAATLSRGGSLQRGIGASIGGVPPSTLPLPLMPLPGVIIMPPNSSMAIQIPKNKERQEPPATASHLMSAMEKGLPVCPEPKPAVTRDARHWSLRRTIMKTHVKASLGNRVKQQITDEAIEESEIESAVRSPGAAAPGPSSEEVIKVGSAPAASLLEDLAGLGPIARAARFGSGDQSQAASLPTSTDIRPPVLPETPTLAAGANSDEQDGLEVDAMSTEQLNQMMAMLQQELLKRQEQQ